MPRPPLRLLSSFCACALVAGWIVAGSAVAQTGPSEAPQSPTVTAAPSQGTPQTDAATPAAPAPGLYAPDYCDMEVTFPEAPYNREQCVPGSRDCYALAAYTMVYDLRTTVEVSATCTPSTPEAFARYNQTVMKAALRGMIAERRLDDHEIQVREHEAMRSASLTGTGMTGLQEKIYTAQIWVGQNSVFTLQAELIGPTHTEADRTFGQILQSVRPRVRTQTPATPPAPQPE